MGWRMSTTTRTGCGSFASSRRSPMWFRSAAAAALVACTARAQHPDRNYTVLVASEAVDLITRITFGPSAGPTLAKVEGTTKVGINAVDPDGPHGLGRAPNGERD